MDFVDIPEGANFEEMPKSGFGRIKTGKSVREVYLTREIEDGRLFIAIGVCEFGSSYGGRKKKRSKKWMRWWFHSPTIDERDAVYL